MKTLKMIVVAGLLLGLTACATQAEGNKKVKISKVNGTISAVSESSITVKPAKKNAEEVTVTINEETKIKINGKSAAASELEVGMKVSVKYDETAAMMIMARKDVKKDKDKKKEKKPAEAPAE